jgi:hypothetical protein
MVQSAKETHNRAIYTRKYERHYAISYGLPQSSLLLESLTGSPVATFKFCVWRAKCWEDRPRHSSFCQHRVQEGSLDFHDSLGSFSNENIVSSALSLASMRISSALLMVVSQILRVSS